MEKIVTNDKMSTEEAFAEFKSSKSQFKKSFLGSAGIIVGIFLTCIVILMTLTDIEISSIKDREVLVHFFYLLFVSYQMYVNTADSGTRAGLETDAYNKANGNYNKLRNSVIDMGLQSLLPAFCTEYIKRELMHTRTIIVANIGMDYEEFLPYLKLGKEGVAKDKTLSKAQKKAIRKAIKITPIRLTPDMIMHGGKRGRSPLGISPQEKKIINYSAKLVSTTVISLFLAMLVFKFVMEPTFDTAVFIITRLVPVILNAFGGYIFGYGNIVTDTVEYMDAQSSIIEEFKRYAESRNLIKDDKIEAK